jgi:hypothetical protein
LVVRVKKPPVSALYTLTHPTIGQSVVNKLTHRIIRVVGTSPKKKITPYAA